MQVLLITFLLLVGHSLADDFTCSDPLARVNSSQGNLIITRNVSTCGFVAQDNSLVFAIRIDDLKLRAGDSLSIRAERSNVNFTYQPPFNAGYFISGLKETVFMFSFKNLDNSVVRTEFIQNDPKLPLDGDINNDFEITPVSLNRLTLSFTKTISNLVHLEVEGAKITNSALSHMLIKESKIDIPIELTDGRIVKIKTSPALESCSKTYNDDKEQQHEIVGPDSSESNRKYKCVNIFRSTLPAPAHYQADFKNFIDLSDPSDQLMLSDGTLNGDLNIDHINAKSYAGQLVTFEGPNLIVVYQSSQDPSKSQIQFKLTLGMKAHGGRIEKEGPISLPANGDVNYVLKPQPDKLAVLEVSKTVKLQGVSLNISADGEGLAVFRDGSILPPVIALNKQGQSLVLDLSGSSYEKLKDAFRFKQLEKHCHISSNRYFQGFSAKGIADKCFWTISAQDPVTINFDLTDKCCLSIRPLDEDKPIYSKCNLNKTEFLPSFNLSQAVIQIDLTKDGEFKSTLSPSQDQTVVPLASDRSVSISSYGYPTRYNWYSDDSSVLLESKDKTYVIVPTDTDLRKGEIINVGQKQLLGDTVITNTTVNITISRAHGSSDFSFHRGYKLSAIQFDRVFEANTSSSQLKTSDGLTKILAKISFATADKKTFARRVAFNITFAKTDGQRVRVYDDRSLAGREITSATDILHGTTTSDTLLVMCSNSREKTTLPIMTIDYLPIECDKSSHICDSNTRCVPPEKLCQGIAYCSDLSDTKLVCSAGPTPPPKVIETGLSSITVFILCVLMLSLGVVAAMYGPDLVRAIEGRFRSGQYTTFTSTE